MTLPGCRRGSSHPSTKISLMPAYKSTRQRGRLTRSYSTCHSCSITLKALKRSQSSLPRSSMAQRRPRRRPHRPTSHCSNALGQPQRLSCHSTSPGSAALLRCLGYNDWPSTRVSHNPSATPPTVPFGLAKAHCDGSLRFRHCRTAHSDAAKCQASDDPSTSARLNLEREPAVATKSSKCRAFSVVLSILCSLAKLKVELLKVLSSVCLWHCVTCHRTNELCCARVLPCSVTDHPSPMT